MLRYILLCTILLFCMLLCVFLWAHLVCLIFTIMFLMPFFSILLALFLFLQKCLIFLSVLDFWGLVFLKVFLMLHVWSCFLLCCMPEIALILVLVLLILFLLIYDLIKLVDVFPTQCLVLYLQYFWWLLNLC